jgi:hypothetical protein
MNVRSVNRTHSEKLHSNLARMSVVRTTTSTLESDNLQGLHGCQMVTVVSNRGVWMAHFWESYTNGKPNTDSVSKRYGIAAFDERMTDFLRGVTVRQAQ